MKWFVILAFASFGAIAQTEMVDEVKRLDWDGSKYKVHLSNFQKEITISGRNEVIPCLENAQKSNMKVLITVDADIPMIKECALYTPGVIPSLKQAQEQTPAEDLKATPPIKKR